MLEKMLTSDDEDLGNQITTCISIYTINIFTPHLFHFLPTVSCGIWTLQKSIIEDLNSGVTCF